MKSMGTNGESKVTPAASFNASKSTSAGCFSSPGAPPVPQRLPQVPSPPEILVVTDLLVSQQCVQGVMEIVAPLRIHLVSPVLPRRDDPRIIQIALSDQMYVTVQAMRQLCYR